MTDETKQEATTEPGGNPLGSKGPVVLWVVIGLGALAGLVLAMSLPSDWLFVPQDATDAHDHTGASEGTGSKEFYACPMFCTRLEEPGKCPVCGMEMELFKDTGSKLPLDATARASMKLRTEAIEPRLLAKEITTLGNFEADETRQKIVSAWVDGRIEKLYADYTGVRVEKGWHLFDLYSPSLYSAQKELQVAKQAAGEASGPDSLRLVEAAREKLRLLGLSADQVKHIESLKEPDLTLTIPAPDSGIVTEKYAHVGMYVKQGEPVFRVTDLSRLWLIADVHERDIGMIALGQSVNIKVNAYAGRTFVGRVGFIHPVLDSQTRTVRVRIEVPNSEGLLRPEMYAEATIFAELGRDAMLARPALDGDYACPMHPLQRSNTPDAKCPICDMAMVAHAHETGSKARKLWAVPREAVLSMGSRHIVYVEWWVREIQHDSHPADETPEYEMLDQPVYQGFAVELGPLVAEYHIMEDGTRHKLREYYPLIGGLPTGIRMPDGEIGWRVVTNGQFLIDSQMELTGKPSLLRPGGGETADPHAGHGG